MVGQDVHQDVEGQDVTGHEEDQQEKLADAEHFPANTTHQQLASITHAVDVRVTELELSNSVASVPGQGRDEQNHDGSTEQAMVSIFSCLSWE